MIERISEMSVEWFVTAPGKPLPWSSGGFVFWFFNRFSTCAARGKWNVSMGGAAQNPYASQAPEGLCPPRFTYPIALPTVSHNLVWARFSCELRRKRIHGRDGSKCRSWAASRRISAFASDKVRRQCASDAVHSGCLHRCVRSRAS